jgi:hypothetical protein
MVTGASVTIPTGTLVTGGIDVIGMLVTGANVSTGKTVLGVIVSTGKDVKGASVSAGKAVADGTVVGDPMGAITGAGNGAALVSGDRVTGDASEVEISQRLSQGLG